VRTGRLSRSLGITGLSDSKRRPRDAVHLRRDRRGVIKRIHYHYVSRLPPYLPYRLPPSGKAADSTARSTDGAQGILNQINQLGAASDPTLSRVGDQIRSKVQPARAICGHIPGAAIATSCQPHSACAGRCRMSALFRDDGNAIFHCGRLSLGHPVKPLEPAHLREQTKADSGSASVREGRPAQTLPPRRRPRTVPGITDRARRGQSGDGLRPGPADSW